jgi:hypothetical protein
MYIDKMAKAATKFCEIELYLPRTTTNYKHKNYKTTRKQVISNSKKLKKLFF